MPLVRPPVGCSPACTSPSTSPLTSAPLVDGAGLLLRRHRLVLEYEGDHHRHDRWQWNRDIARQEALEAALFSSSARASRLGHAFDVLERAVDPR